MRDLDGPSTPRHWQRIAPPHWLNLARHSNDGTQPKNVTDRCALRDQRGKPEEPLLKKWKSQLSTARSRRFIQVKVSNAHAALAKVYVYNIDELIPKAVSEPGYASEFVHLFSSVCLRNFQMCSIGQRLAHCVAASSWYVLVALGGGWVSIRSSTSKLFFRKRRIHSP